MDNLTKKLITLIDQLLVLYRSNPDILLSEYERNRLRIVVNKILGDEKITDKEWEKLKPYNPEPPGQIEKRRQILRNEIEKEQIKSTRELNKDIIEETEKIIKQTKQLQQQFRIATAKKIPTRADVRICKKCNQRFTVGEYDKHIKTCGKKKKTSKRHS